jgi:hypothetical protein
MAHVCIVINRHATDIHLDEIGLEGLKILFFACECVVEVDHMLIIIIDVMMEGGIQESIS